jgi:hypothetical protein
VYIDIGYTIEPPKSPRVFSHVYRGFFSCVVLFGGLLVVFQGVGVVECLNGTGLHHCGFSVNVSCVREVCFCNFSSRSLFRSYDEVEIKDMALGDYLAVKQKHKYMQFLPHSAGRFSQKRFRKAHCPIVEVGTGV